MHRHTRRHPQRRARVPRRQTLFIHTMPGLVNGTVERVQRVVGVKARGQAHVVTGAFAEWMERNVEPTPLVVEAESRRDREGHPSLSFDIKTSQRDGPPAARPHPLIDALC